MDLTKRLDGRIAFVTGGAQGQGVAHTRRLAEEGATVHFADINEAVGRAAEEQLRADGLDVHFTVLDVSKLDQWQRVIGEIDERHGRLDILVNNAGIADFDAAEQLEPAAWQRTVDVNQTSIYYALKVSVPLLRRSEHASIINTSSIFGLVGVDGYLAYVASKGAVTLMTKSAAMTYGPDGIRVNSIHPGYIDTPMLQDEFAALGEGAAEAVLQTIPLGRFATAEEIAPAVAFLASDDASYISGAELIIDGAHLAGR